LGLLGCGQKGLPGTTHRTAGSNMQGPSHRCSALQLFWRGHTAGHGRPGRGNHVEEDHGMPPLYGLPVRRGCGNNEENGRPHRACAVAKAERTPSAASSTGSKLQGPPRACFGRLHDGGRHRSAVTCGRRRMARWSSDWGQAMRRQ
jgi:hypothetical protein